MRTEGCPPARVLHVGRNVEDWLDERVVYGLESPADSYPGQRRFPSPAFRVLPAAPM